jgi:hypothetical protein
VALCRRYARGVSSRHPDRRPSHAARLAACALLTLACTGFAAAPALSAAGESGAFNELSEAAQQPQTQTTATTGSTGSTSNSKKTVFIALGAAAVLLLAIAFVIVRDARRVAPAGEGPLSESGSTRDSAAALRKRRAKTKAARRQRKRNR